MRQLFGSIAPAIASSVGNAALAAPAADTLYHNARIYTADAAHTEAQAVAVQIGRAHV